MSPPGPGGGPLLHSGRSIGILELAPLGESPPHLTLLTRSGKNSCPGPPQRQSETMGATSFFFFFFQMQFFSNIACHSFGSEIWGVGEAHGKKKGKKKNKPANCTKPFPGKAQALGCSGLMTGPSPPPSGAPALLVEAQMGVRSVPHVRELSGGRMAACVYISLCVRARVCVYI